MKKIIFLLLYLFLSVGIVKAEELYDSFHSIFHYKYHYVDNNGKFGDFEIIQRDSDSSYAYCIEPGMPLTLDAYHGYHDFSFDDMASKVSLSKEQLQDISIYSYFGYLYEDHSDSSWLVAVQAKIWKLLGRDFQFTSRNSQANPYLYIIDTPFEIEREMNELEQLKEAYYHPPEFDEFTLNIGETKEIVDFSLYDYELAQKYENVEKKGHKLFIKGNEVGKHEIVLQRRFLNYPTTPFVYHLDYGQNLFVPGNIPTIYIKISYTVKENEITLTKYDEEDKKCSLLFDDTIYSLYKEDGTHIKDVSLKKCKAKINNLPLGSYYFLEKIAPKGYELNTSKIVFTIDKDSPTSINISTFDKKIKRHLKIHKDYVENKNSLIPEENAVFQVISKDSLEVISTIHTNQNGEGETILEQGDYILKQIKGKDNYAFIDDTYFSVDYDDIVLNLKNEPFVANVIVQKIDAKTGNNIKIKGIAFELFDVLNNKKVCPNEECLYYTDKDGKVLLNDLVYSTYELREIEQKINGYLVNNNHLTFNVSTSKELYYEFANEPKEVSLVIKKTYQDGQENLLEEGAMFTILSDENIVGNITTDKNGEARINIPYGKYKVVQKKGKIGYQFVPDIIVDIDDEAQDVVTLNLVNQPVLKNVKILKKDSSSKEAITISKIKFELYDVIKSKKVCSNAECTWETDENGEIFIPNLVYSSYELKEIPQFIKGYSYQTEGLSFTIDETSKETTILDFFDEAIEGKIHIVKKNSLGENLANVSFHIYDENHNLISIATTHQDGCVDVFLNLGKYYIQEVSTKEGYELDKQIYEVDLFQNSSSNSLVTKNLEIINYKIPNTYMQKNSFPFTVLLIGVLLYVKKKLYIN